MEEPIKRNKRCIIPGCTYGCFNGEENHFFTSGKRNLELWRVATGIPLLTPTSRVCVEHFLDSDKSERKDVSNEGERRRLRLKKTAIPTQKLVPAAPPSTDRGSRKYGAKRTNKNEKESTTTETAIVQIEQPIGADNEEICISNDEINVTAETNQSANVNCVPPAVDDSSSTSNNAVKSPAPTSTATPPPVTPVCGLDHTYIMSGGPSNASGVTDDIGEAVDDDVTMEEATVPSDETTEARPDENISGVVIPEASSNVLEENDDGDVIMEDPTVPLSSSPPEESSTEAQAKKPSNAPVQLVSVGLTQEFIDELPEKVHLPDKDWFWVLNKARKQASCSVHIPLGDRMLIKTVIITSPTTVTFLANGKPLKLHNLQTTFTDHHGLYKIINRFSAAVSCVGIRDPALKNFEPSNASSATKEKDGTIRSNSCTYLCIPGKLCRKCREVRAYLQKNTQKLLDKSAKIKDEVKYLNRKIARLSAMLEKRKQKMVTLKKELTEAKAEAQKQSISHLMQQLNPMEKTILRLLITRSSLQDKDTKGARYGDSVMSHCCLFWLKSPPTYRFLRKNCIVPLPCESTITNYIKANKNRMENIESDFVRNLIGLKPKETADSHEKEPPEPNDPEPIAPVEVDAETQQIITIAETNETPLYTDIEIILT